MIVIWFVHDLYMIFTNKYYFFIKTYDFFIKNTTCLSKIRSNSNILQKSEKRKSACGIALWPRSSKVVKNVLYTTKCVFLFKNTLEKWYTSKIWKKSACGSALWPRSSKVVKHMYVFWHFVGPLNAHNSAHSAAPELISKLVIS